MRVLLPVFEALLWLLALAGFGFAFFIVTAGRAIAGDSAKTAGTLIAVYYALPAFAVGAIGLAGGATMSAIDRLRGELADARQDEITADAAHRRAERHRDPAFQAQVEAVKAEQRAVSTDKDS